VSASPGRISNYPDSTWLRAMATEERASDPCVALVYVQRDAMAGTAELSPLTGLPPQLARICDACED
jgi:hypothetical protein